MSYFHFKSFSSYSIPTVLFVLGFIFSFSQLISNENSIKTSSKIIHIVISLILIIGSINLSRLLFKEYKLLKEFKDAIMDFYILKQKIILYGKVPVEEFIQLCKEFENTRKEQKIKTFSNSKTPNLLKSQKSSYNKSNNKINWFKVISLVLIAFVFFIGYIITSNWIYNEKVYTTNIDWFYLEVWQAHISGKCFQMGNPFVTIDYKKNLVKITTYFQKRQNDCSEKEIISYANPTFTISDFKNWEFVRNPNNLTYTYEINKTENRIYLKVNLSYMRMNELYDFSVITKIEPKFHNYYKFSVEGASKLEKLDFDYNTDFLNGYTCDENCFTVYQGDIKKDFQIFKGFSKSWEFNDSNVFIRFNPKSNFWLFWLKILDIFIVLGKNTTQVLCR